MQAFLQMQQSHQATAACMTGAQPAWLPSWVASSHSHLQHAQHLSNHHHATVPLAARCPRPTDRQIGGCAGRRVHVFQHVQHLRSVH